MTKNATVNGLSAGLRGATEALSEALLRTEPILGYRQAQDHMEADAQAEDILRRLSAAQADLRERQQRNQVRRADIDSVRAIQQEAQQNQAIMGFVEAQQAAQNYLAEVNQEISQLLGVDFPALAGKGCCG